ncbi:hypothetical protein ACFQMA_04230 [Halosimplex aquaticum]|uniref:DUF7344 domain-containing protein n=1 Tax=Halosimplex aquaticum TaxID=3026162 RepID=A0ABD5Y157_9EURY|nr:hypothetical protein [Halosimplex aquaticum]
MSSASQHANEQDVVPEETEADADQAVPTEAAEEAETEEESSSQLPLDHVFEILKNERRRTVLHYLREHGGTVSLGELAEHVAAVENGTTVAQVTSNERKCVYVGLYQCHLPKMDDMDIVEFNQNRGRISLGPNAAQLFEYLEESDEVDRPWPLYYGSLTAVGAVLLVASQLGAAAVGLTATVVSTVVLLGLVGVASAQTLDQRSAD